MKLNIGSGKRQIEGYRNVDAVKRPNVDIVAPAHNIPQIGKGQVTDIAAIHVWEHFYRWECDAVIREWKRLLAPGGRLVLELPNFRKCCENFLKAPDQIVKHPDQLTYWGIYGDPRDQDPYMTHRWGWTPETLTAFLEENGFVEVVEVPTQFHVVGREFRDMRIEAVKA